MCRGLSPSFASFLSFARITHTHDGMHIHIVTECSPGGRSCLSFTYQVLGLSFLFSFYLVCSLLSNVSQIVRTRCSQLLRIDPYLLASSFLLVFIECLSTSIFFRTKASVTAFSIHSHPFPPTLPLGPPQGAVWC